jgi:hypothetical protein
MGNTQGEVTCRSVVFKSCAIRGPLDDKYEDYHHRICKVMCFRRMEQKTGYVMLFTWLYCGRWNLIVFIFL